MNFLNYKKGGSGYVLIKIKGNLFDTNSGKKGVNGQEITIDATFQKEKRARIDGEVIQLPFFMGNAPISQLPVGYPAYGMAREMFNEDMDENIPELYSPIGGIYNYKMMSDIEQEVQLGDRIYFKWRVTFNHKNLVAQSIDPPTWIFRVSYDNIYCAIRDSKIIMVGSHVLIDPVMESWDSILRPTYYDIKDKQGNLIPRPKEQWLQIKTAPSKKDKQGIVAEIGSPLKGEKCYLSKGDKILFKPNMKSLIRIENKSYFVLRQDQIVCKVLEEQIQ